MEGESRTLRWNNALKGQSDFKCIFSPKMDQSLRVNWCTFEYITSCLSGYYRKGIFNKIQTISKSVFKKNFKIFIWPIWAIAIGENLSFFFILFSSWNSKISMNLKKQSLNAFLLSPEINFVEDVVQIYCPWKSIQRSTVKPVYNNHLGEEVSVVVIDRWSL